jgi:hypothetical protein
VRQRDPCAVDAAPLAALLRAFVDDWHVTRPPNSGQFTGNGNGGPVPVPALAWLAAEARLPVSRVETLVRGRSRTVDLDDADRLVTALGFPHAFHDGTFEVRPNPCAPAKVRARCCGGSLART